MSDCNPEQNLDPRVRRTRKLLVDAFEGLAREKTIQSITVGDIATRADVNRATFYAHFPDKFALFEYSIRARFREVLQGQVPCPSVFQFENLRGLCLAVAQFLSGFGPSQCRKADQEFEPLIEATVQTTLHHFALAWCQHERSLQRADVSPEIFASYFSWAVFGAALQWSRSDRSVPPADFARQLETLLLSGLTVPRKRMSADELPTDTVKVLASTVQPLAPQ